MVLFHVFQECRVARYSWTFCATRPHLAVHPIWPGIFQIFSFITLFGNLRCWYGWAFSNSSVLWILQKKWKYFRQISSTVSQFTVSQGFCGTSPTGHPHLCVVSNSSCRKIFLSVFHQTQLFRSGTSEQNSGSACEPIEVDWPITNVFTATDIPDWSAKVQGLSTRA